MEVELWKQIFVCVLTLAVFVVFFKEWLSPELASIGALVALTFVGILDGEDVSLVFGNPAPIIIACMFVLSAALERTGLIEALGHGFEKLAGEGEIRILVVLFFLVAGLSAFVNNTPVVVVFLPIVIALCRRRELKASRYLIPLSYAAIVGGTCTMIGTSTNILVSGIVERELNLHFSMFEITPLGLVFAAITLVYLATIGRKLLPDRVTLSGLFEAEEGREFLTQAFVSEDSPLVGKAFPDTALAKMRDLRVIEVMRNGQPLKRPLPEICFEEGDQLLFKSRVSGVVDITKTQGLE
ncbi:MAG: SLC13 family permease, partial [Verrucomicrobiota bacterium]